MLRINMIVFRLRIIYDKKKILMIYLSVGNGVKTITE